MPPTAALAQPERLTASRTNRLRVAASLSLPEARRVALAAQGFARRRSEIEPDAAAIRRAVGRLGALQLDFLGERCRARALHAAVLAARALRRGRSSSRRGGASVAGARSLFEYWGHEASLIRRRPASALALADGGGPSRRRRLSGSTARFGPRRPDFGPRACWRRSGGASRRSAPASSRGRHRARLLVGVGRRQAALEWLFWAGLVTTAARRGFERVYDLPERVLPRRSSTPDAG